MFFFRCQITEAQAPFHTEQQDKNLTIISKYSLSESMIGIFHGGGSRGTPQNDYIIYVLHKGPNHGLSLNNES